MSGVRVRAAAESDLAAVSGLAAELAQSFVMSPPAFAASFAAAIRQDHACVLVAIAGNEVIGYLLGFAHPTFYANGPVALVEEIFVHTGHRGHGIGRALMGEFERWATTRHCVLVTLATRRATEFYSALGYQESATYLRKTLSQPS